MVGQVALDLFKRSRLHRNALAVEVAEQLVAEGRGGQRCGERIVTAYGKPQEALGFIRAVSGVQGDPCRPMLRIRCTPFLRKRR